MKGSIRSTILKICKITGITVASILLLLFLAPILFPGTVSQDIKEWTNSSIHGEVNFSKARLSFFSHFPSLTLNLYDFSLKGSAPFEKDTLVSAQKIAFGINLETLIFNKTVSINKIFLDDAMMNIEVNEKGEANYNVYESKPAKAKNPADTAGASLKIEKIVLNNIHLIYNDRSIPMEIEANGLDYKGSGDLSKAIFDLSSHFKIDSLDFYFGKDSYFLKKKIDADLVTKINTHSLSFLFERNDLIINRLPVKFNGRFDFLDNGYDMDFSVSSLHSDLYDFFTALPPQYVEWLQKTKVKGMVDIVASLKGKYIASQKIAPTLDYNMKVRDGSIAYEGAPAPATNLFVDFDTRLPSLNEDSLALNIDSVYFNIEKDYLSGHLHTVGMAAPYIATSVNATLDLEKLDKALGFSLIDMKGYCRMKMVANGRYRTVVRQVDLRHIDTVIASIPRFQIQSSIENGYIKYNSLPVPIEQINFSADISCADSNYKKTAIHIDHFSAIALKHFIKGSLAVDNLSDYSMKADLESSVDLADIQKFYPLDSITLKGLLKFDLHANGKYVPSKKIFPLATANLNLSDGFVQTKYYPHPIDQIQVQTKIADATGATKDLDVVINPASFVFEGKPFAVKGSFHNLDDIAYDVQAKGELDIQKIYQVFSRKGIDVTGMIKADLSLKGRESDALNRRYGNMHNSGTLEAENLRFETEYFPLPFLVKQGLFKFQDDKMWFKKFLAEYGRTDMQLDGYLENAINYFLSGKSKLQGDFNLHSRLLSVDDFMFFASSKSSETAKPVMADTAGTKKSSGVVMIPANLDLKLKADADRIAYNGLNISNFKGSVTISNGQVQLNDTYFNLIGCNTEMNGMYSGINPQKAVFDYHITANDFDIKRAYDSVKLLRDMMTSAGKAQGIVSLDYKLQGKLNADMYPIYPSLTGGGVLSVKNVKVKGLKLFNAVSKQTGKDSLNSPDLSKVDFKTTIKNNLVTLERTKFKVAGFRLRIEGQSSFDGPIKFKMRVGLPPLGIIGIPMNITGTSEDPKIKVGKGGEDELIGTEDKDE